MAEQVAPQVVPQEAAPISVRMAEADSHVELRTARGDPEVVPVSVLVKDAQMYRSGQQMLDDAKDKLRQANADIQDAQRYRLEQERLQKDPDGYAQSAIRMASIAKGSPLAINQQNTDSETESQPVARNTSALEQRLAQLESSQHQTQVSQHQARVEREVNEVLDEFPVFKDPERKALRANAELVVLAAKVNDPKADIRRVARDFHGTLVSSLGAQRTAVRDAREARTANMPAISPQAGSPDTKALETTSPKAADMRTDKWKEGGRAFLAKLSGMGG